MTRRGIIIIVLVLISVCILPFVIFSYQALIIIPPDPTPDPVIIEIDAPTLNSIIPNPDPDGRVELNWNDIDIPGYSADPCYKILRSKDGGVWQELFTEYSFYDDPKSSLLTLENGVYKYKVRAFRALSPELYAESEYSNIQSVTVGVLSLPTNPSIIINNGDLTTDSFELTLTLSCDNADEMHFQIDIGIWTNWIAYSTTNILTLTEGHLDNNKFYIGVVFKNTDGVSVEVFDDIIYEGPSNGNNGDNGDEEPPVDYTLMYVLIGVLVGLIGMGIYLRSRKNK